MCGTALWAIRTHTCVAVQLFENDWYTLCSIRTIKYGSSADQVLLSLCLYEIGLWQILSENMMEDVRTTCNYGKETREEVFLQRRGN